MSKFSDEEQAELTQIQEYHANKQKIKLLEQQLASAHRDATEEVAKAHKRGWEQGKRECENIANNLFKYESGYYHYREDVGDAIAAMEYKGESK